MTGTNDAGQAVSRTTTTADDGSYRFDGLLPGTYEVTVQDANKNIGIRSIVLGTGQTLSHQDFSFLGPNSTE